MLTIAGLAPFLAGCDEPAPALATAVAAEPEVSVVTVKPQPRSVVRELPGRIAPTRVAEVRPRVSGIVVERTFEQGSEVKAGDPLYQIDPQPFEVELQASEAALAKADAAFDQAAQHARAHRDAGAVSRRVPRRENETRDRRDAPGRGRRRGAQGRRRARQAQSRLRHDPRADQRPIGAALVTEGALVGAERRHQSGHHPAARSDLCRLHPVGRRAQPAAARVRQRRSANASRPTPPRCAWSSTTARSIRMPGKLLFSDATVDRAAPGR